METVKDYWVAGTKESEIWTGSAGV
jgi:hypothetical protein